jgi:hypothetical protein
MQEHSRLLRRKHQEKALADHLQHQKLEELTRKGELGRAMADDARRNDQRMRTLEERLEAMTRQLEELAKAKER